MQILFKIKDLLLSLGNKQIKNENIKKQTLKEIQILPLNDVTVISSDLRKTIYFIFEENKIIDLFPSYQKYFIKVSSIDLQGKNIMQGHNLFNDKYFYLAEKINGLPTQDFNMSCPFGTYLIILECINKISPNMGSFFGYKGYYLSLLVNIPNKNIFDARGVKAN